MNITFLIGNGFDLNLGLKTRYKDFYPYFKKNASDDNLILKWMNEDEELWSDLEEKLGMELCKLGENDKEKFYDDKYEMDSLLIDYLRMEQDRYDIFEEIQDMTAQEVKKTLLNYMEKISPTGRELISNLYELHKSEDYKYNFICFNYTDTLDRILATVTTHSRIIATHKSVANVVKNDIIGDVIHVHGTLDNEMILGVNDTSQVNNEMLKKDEEFLDTFIKRRMNIRLEQKKTERAMNTIKNSSVICVFGMSIGNTDSIWWNELLKWLIGNHNNILIVFWRGLEEELKNRLPVKIIRQDNKLKSLIIDKSEVKYTQAQIERIKKQMFMSFNSDIFSFTKCSVTEWIEI